MKSWWTRVFVVALAAWIAAASARGQEPEPQPDFAQKLDQFVGDYPNYFLAKFLFFDVVFWDDQLPLGEGVGAEVGDEVLTSYREGAGYVWQRKGRVAEPALILDAPVARAIGKVQVELRSGTRRDGDTETPIVVGRVLPDAVDLAALGLEGAPPGTPDAEAIATVVSLAPFGIQVDRRTGTIVEVDVVMRPDLLGLVAGDRVVGPDGQPAVLVAPDPAGGWTTLSVAERIDPGPLPNPDQAVMPGIVAWLVMGAVFFTVRMRFVNLWGLRHAVQVTAGTYDNPEDAGEISHFQALSSALSATVGLGNIAGVAIAITVGGPGAMFWMVVAGFLGMTSKFTECTLGQMYREVRPDGTVSGGPMHYLSAGLSELGLGPLGVGLSWMFAIMCVGGSFGGGNMFQGNQSFEQFAVASGGLVDPGNGVHRLVYGVLLACLVGAVILGGIKRIGAAASVIVPVMCVLYVVTGLVIVALHASAVPAAVGEIVSQAFTPAAGYGGLLGVLAQGFKRASFSNEAGVGSASIAHSAAQTPFPVREGIVALLEPFIDTIIVCSTTGLVVIVTGVYLHPDVGTGVAMTSAAFDTVFPGYRYVLTATVFLFAFSTMISWSYYGERCATWMFGERVRIPYRFVFLGFVVLGCVIKLGNVVDFSDMMILGMAFPNIFGAVLLSGRVRRALDDYWADLSAGKFTRRPA